MKGYNNRILRVNLSDGNTAEEKLPEDLIRNYIGGTGICAKLLFEELKPGIDPLSPENKLIFGTGPLTGTLWMSAGRGVVCSKSPATGIWAESHFGGFFAPELKYAGYDFLIIEGASERPVYLEINDREVDIKDAAELWGKNTHEVETKLKKGLPECEVMSIGRAGEKLVKYAAIITNYASAAGRCGLGAVMGVKKLKAIAVRGTGNFGVHDADNYIRKIIEAETKLRKSQQNNDLHNIGTNILVAYKSAIGELVTRNHSRGIFEGADKITGEYLREKYFVKHRSCFNCRTRCKKVYRAGKTISGGPEYEGTMAFGSNCMVSDFEAILEANYLCNEYGLDTISAGCVVAFAMECHEHGLLKSGFPIKWGDGKTVVKLVKMIGEREGIGDLLAEGMRSVAGKLGAEKFAMEVKGLEISGQDGRAHRSVGLTHAISVRGADHLRSLVTVDQLGYKEAAKHRFGEHTLPEICDPYSETNKAMAVKVCEDVFAVRDSLITCWYTCGWPPVFWLEDFAEILYPVTGLKFAKEELATVGERIATLRRLFNVREGLDATDDYLPERFLKEPLPDGPSKGQVVNLEVMLKEYYLLRNWDENGLPTRECAEKLGLVNEWEIAMEAYAEHQG
ncbi:MAG: aldehyde ferredoxin oxidoreductase family protein [Thermoplasmata archaeon]|nr:aldehyde ferredoxin oxidoreductase family protein [Thermoplasmata archaeon]